MKFGIITYIPHTYKKGNGFSSYPPYISEMNLWIKFSEEVLIMAPLEDQKKFEIEEAYEHSNIRFFKTPSLNFQNFRKIIFSLLKIPYIIFNIIRVCYLADHIHLRCPGNISLLGCIIQVFFPKKTKTVKYAGNWDPSSLQPISYRFQKWILNNEFLSKNVTVLVYGHWPKSSKNVSPFYTASFTKDHLLTQKNLNLKKEVRFLFIGSLVEGKQPILAIKMIEKCIEQNIDAVLDLYGEGDLEFELQDYINGNNLQKKIKLKGFIKTKDLIEVYKESHFVILPSKSEGWPKALAEGMFFGCIPIGTPVSCVPWMLGEGSRGIILSDVSEDILLSSHGKFSFVAKIKDLLEDEDGYFNMAMKAQMWSREYTLERMENDIKHLLAKSNLEIN